MSVLIASLPIPKVSGLDTKPALQTARTVIPQAQVLQVSMSVLIPPLYTPKVSGLDITASPSDSRDCYTTGTGSTG